MCWWFMANGRISRKNILLTGDAWIVDATHTFVASTMIKVSKFKKKSSNVWWSFWTFVCVRIVRTTPCPVLRTATCLAGNWAHRTTRPGWWLPGVMKILESQHVFTMKRLWSLHTSYFHPHFYNSYRWWFEIFVCLFIPIPGEMIQFDQYFSDGLNTTK